MWRRWENPTQIWGEILPKAAAGAVYWQLLADLFWWRWQLLSIVLFHWWGVWGQLEEGGKHYSWCRARGKRPPQINYSAGLRARKGQTNLQNPEISVFASEEIEAKIKPLRLRRLGMRAGRLCVQRFGGLVCVCSRSPGRQSRKAERWPVPPTGRWRGRWTSSLSAEAHHHWKNEKHIWLLSAKNITALH